MSNIPQLVAATVRQIPEPYLPPNLTLRFALGVGYFEVDADGNPEEKATEFIVKAAVRTDKPSPNQMPGQIGTNDIPLVGRCVEPKIIPNEIYLEKPAIAELFDSTSGQIIKGKFRFSPIAQNRFTEFVEHLGMRIRGFLVVDGRV